MKYFLILFLHVISVRQTVTVKLSKTSVTNLTVCWILEEDSYYSSYERLAAAVDLAISNANAYILPDTLHLQLAYQNAGPSCSDMQYSVTANVMHMLQDGSCHVFVGAGCPTTAVALYGIAHHLNVPILGCPAAGTASLALNVAFDRFPLLIRASFGFSDVVSLLNVFLTTHGYTHLGILRDEAYNLFTLLSKFTVVRLRSLNPVLSRNTVEYSIFAADRTLETYRRLLETANDASRVILILAHGSAVRQIMIAASQLGFTDGDYLFLSVEMFTLKYWGSIRFNEGDIDDAVAKEAFQNLLVIGLRKSIPNNDILAFEERVKLDAQAHYNYTFRPLERLDPIIVAHYEAIMMYAQEATNMVKDGLDEVSGAEMVSRILETEYHGVVGLMRIGKDGERHNDLELRIFNLKSAEFETTMEFVQVNFTEAFLRPVNNFTWSSPNGRLPRNEPICGFRGEKCRHDKLPDGVVAAAVVIPVLVVLGLSTGAVITFVRFRKLRKDYNPNWWRISSEELIIRQNRTESAMSRKTMASHSSVGRSAYMCEILATYKGGLVALTDVTVYKRHPNLDTIDKMTLLKSCVSANLQKFIGISLTSTGTCEYIVNELCAKGSLTDVLENEMVKLDWSFKNNLIKDIVFGVTYMHSTPIISHGGLNSHTCLIDARFTLKISDYGLPFFRNPADLLPPRPNEPERSYEILLWRAPELLRQVMPPIGTQKGDVYSFAILLQQIILRSGPFQLPTDPLDLSDREIVQEVIAANIPPVRPRVPRSACSNQLYDLMERCWEEFPMERPAFPKIKDHLKKVIGDVGDNIIDLLLKRMEQYATDLELKVAEKTQQFMEEKSRSEELLNQMLPRAVAAALTKGEHVEPEAFESVSIFFSDIVGFTTISAAGSPMDVISLLNRLYTFFDGVLEQHDVYKVETIGDAYMVSSGLPERNGNRHAVEISHMSLELLKGIKLVTVPNRPFETIEIRAGINSGPCVAGVVGSKMPRYCLFGDTVNVASRMESTGEPMKIQITYATKELLTDIGGFVMAERGPITVKGKGTLTTFWLIAAEHE